MAEAREALLAIGSHFGEFRIIRELGRGGMGAVYLAQDDSTSTQYAIKVMYPESPGVGQYFVKRFIREAEIAMKVNHPNLIHVYDVGRDPDTGFAYMIMDYLPGGSLRDRMMRRLMDKEGPMPLKEALRVTRAIISALDAAAKQGVVHRDIKPDNILFDAALTPYLADLGVARQSDDEATTILTMSNVVVGTPAYMAPEQMTDSHHVDVRADLYSVGIVLWEMLAGERPNAGASTAELMAMAVNHVRIPNIRTKRAVPSYVVELLDRLCETHIEKRFQSPNSVLRFLKERHLREHRRNVRLIVGISVFGVAAVIGSGVITWNILSAKHQAPELDWGPTSAETNVVKEAFPRESIVESASPEIKPMPKVPAAIVITNVAPRIENVAPRSAIAAPISTNAEALSNSVEGMLEEKSPMQESATHPSLSLEDIFTRYQQLQSLPPREARRKINGAINAARHLDPDFTLYDCDGNDTENAIALNPEERDIYRQGRLFFFCERYKRRHHIIPNLSTIRKEMGMRK